MQAQPPAFFIVGAPQAGKSEARRIVARLTRLRGESCSTAIRFLLARRRGLSVDFAQRAPVEGIPPEELPLSDVPKEELRPALVELGDWWCGLGEVTEKAVVDLGELYRAPSAIVRSLYLGGVNVIDGVRRRLELQHAIDHLVWNGVRSFVIYVERPGAPDVKDNTEDLRAFADEVVANDGDLKALEEKLKAVLDKHFGVPAEPAAPEKK